jgi:uncharacterized protein YneF (UPF0154 family)
MSLHKFADMVAKQGRGDDSLLIHMTPDEVQRLQAFAQANGRSLTINPDTGLPEAGMLSDLFKMVAPIALGAFLGPGAFGIAGMGLSAGTAGLVTGGLTTLATGSLSRGLMAGLGAYGGAGLAEGLAGTGAGILGQQASEATAMELANAGAGEGLTGEAYNKAFQQSVTDKMAGANTFSAGLNAAKAAPMDFLKQNMMPLAAAAAPIMAGSMVPTTTKMPENTNPAYIRQKLYDPFTQTYKSLAPVKASEFGSRSFSDAYTNPQTGGIASLDQRQTTPMAAGGIVALAGGGVSAEDIRAYLSANPGMSDADIASAMNQYGVSTADMAAATGSNLADIQSRYDAVQPAAPAATVAAPEPVYTPEPAPVYTPEPAPVYTPEPARPSRAIEPEDTYVPPVAPAGIETLTAAMPPVAPVAPVAPAKPTDAEIVKFLTDNPTISDADIATIMRDTGLKPEDVARATGSKVADVQSRYDAVTPTTPVAPAGIETLTAAMPPVTTPTPPPAGIETLTAPVTPPKPTNKDIQEFLAANPNMSDKAIFEAMNKYGVGAAQMAEATGLPIQEIQNRLVFMGNQYLNPNSPERGTYTITDIQNYLKDNPGMTDAQIGDAMLKFGVGNQQLASATGLSVDEVVARRNKVNPFDEATKSYRPSYAQYTNEQIAQYLKDNPTADIAKAVKDTNADPKAVNAYIASIADSFRGSTDTTGGSGTLGIYNQMKAQGVDSAELYKAEIANDPKYAGYTQPMIQKAYDLSKGAYELANKIEKDKIAPDPKLGYDKEWVKFMDTNKYTVDDMAQAFGLSRNEVKARYDAAKKEPVKPVTPVTPTTFTNPVTGGTITAPTRTTTTVLPTDPTVNAPPGTKNPYGGPNTPGDKTYNPDGSITVTPNIPGRPYGGFSGMDEVKNAYTAGGGSTGYVPKTPTTAAEHAVAYNRMTGDSAAAYKYLMGQGANPVQSGAASTSTGIMRPYFSEGMRYKPKFLSYDKEGNLTTSASNPNAPKAGDAKALDLTRAKTIEIVDSSGNNTETYTAVLQEDGTYLAGNGKRYDVTGKQLAAGGGMMGYAVGGGMGTLGSYSDGGRLLKGPGDGVSDSIPATIGAKRQPARLADGEFVIPARIVSELGNGSTDAGAKKLYAMMDRVQRARGKTTGKNKVAANSRADKYLPA